MVCRRENEPMVVRIRLYTISTSSRNLLLIQFTQQQHIHRSITIYCMPPYGPYDQVFNTLPHDGEYAISPIGPILKIFQSIRSSYCEPVSPITSYNQTTYPPPVYKTRDLESITDSNDNQSKKNAFRKWV